jgi:hypothetical protein
VVRALYSNIRDKHIIRLNRLAIARRGNAVSANEVEERGRMVGRNSQLHSNFTLIYRAEQLAKADRMHHNASSCLWQVTMLVYWLEEQDTIGEGIDFLVRIRSLVLFAL